MSLTTLAFSRISQLANRLGKHIAIYDLETTTFRGKPSFGITEMSCFFVSPEGECAWESSLINPERSIDARVVELTGITAQMVRDKPTWGEAYAQMFSNMAGGDCWVAGFNNATFDNPAVADMNRRYGVPLDSFLHTFDIRTLHLSLNSSTSRAGKLADIAQQYGVQARGSLHRAQADVAMTAELLDAILAKFGLEAVLAQITGHSDRKPAPTASSAAGPRGMPSSTNAAIAQGILRPAQPRSTAGEPSGRPARLTAASVADYVRGKSGVTLAALAQALGYSEQAISFEVGKAIDTRMADPSSFAYAEAQDWLCHELIEMDPAVLTQGKLKPIHEVLAPRDSQGFLDYVQLRVALLRAGQGWSSLRPVN